MTDARTGTVYTLTDPRNGLIRYVGATMQPLADRLAGHLYNADRGSAVAAWVRELLTENLRPTATALRVLPEADLLEAEREEISRHYDEGWPLTNVKDYPGAPHAVRAERKLAAARRRAERLADIGGDLLASTLEELVHLEAQVRDLEARIAFAAARRPTDEDNFEVAIRLLLHDWNAEPIGGTLPVPEEDLECLVPILLELAIVGHRRGVSFSTVVSGVGHILLRDMRWGAIQRRPEPDTAA